MRTWMWVAAGVWGASVAAVAFIIVRALLEDRDRQRHVAECLRREREEGPRLYPLSSVPRRIPTRYLAECQRIWEATLERERFDREWRKAA